MSSLVGGGLRQVLVSLTSSIWLKSSIDRKIVGVLWVVSLSYWRLLPYSVFCELGLLGFDTHGCYQLSGVNRSHRRLDADWTLDCLVFMANKCVFSLLLKLDFSSLLLSCRDAPRQAPFFSLTLNYIVLAWVPSCSILELPHWDQATANKLFLILTAFEHSKDVLLAFTRLFSERILNFSAALTLDGRLFTSRRRILTLIHLFHRLILNFNFIIFGLDFLNLQFLNLEVDWCR